MTNPVTQNAYLVSNATGTIYPTLIFDRPPTTSDFNYPVTQRWVDTSDNNREYFLLNFTSSNGVVSPNWVILSQGSGTVDFLEGNSGGPVGPDSSSIINVVGTGSITIVGDPLTNTLTTELTGLTNHNVLVGAGTTTVGLIDPSTSGYVLTSNGGSADPTFQAVSASGAITQIDGDSGSMTPTAGVVTISGGSTGLTTSASASTMDLTGTLIVGNGGTGDTSFTAYSVICGGTTSGGNLQNVSGVGTATQVLTSNGAGALPSWQTNPFVNINTIVIQSFTTSGTYTPTADMEYCIIEVVGGGGGGGGATNTVPSVGAGGGGGGYARQVFSAADIGASQTVTIGSGGTAGAGGGTSTGGTGGTGGTSSVGSLISATGGAGGAGAAYNTLGSHTVGGAGGVGSLGAGGGGFVAYGSPGGYGIWLNIPATGQTSCAGTGGSSIYGGGAYSDNSGTGGNGNAPGGGAAGGGNTNASGGAGADGIVVITEYVS